MAGRCLWSGMHLATFLQLWTDVWTPVKCKTSIVFPITYAFLNVLFPKKLPNASCIMATVVSPNIENWENTITTLTVKVRHTISCPALGHNTHSCPLVLTWTLLRRDDVFTKCDGSSQRSENGSLWEAGGSGKTSQMKNCSSYFLWNR